MDSRNVINENVFLAYFLHLNSTLNVYKKVDISKWEKLTSFLKSSFQYYKPKKSRKHSKETKSKKAPDSQYLLIKIALIMGITGACRCD
ncbi:hypothetical protein NQ315_017460 [Exocentrus adspersus]|uniref:Uncharacterized protein n=1 Tax=Exocentrus adspersus TaxID=1586481 RepID=A0AAV8VKN3_9CUCU|nr:hypothetical protein NQ315_017460 [Exocentrus adspersus]